MSAALATGTSDESHVKPLGRPPKRHDQRQRILQAAAKAIATVGYERCSLADIATELDLSRPALYHYFPTKQRIFTEIAMTSVKGMFEQAGLAIDDEQSYAQQLQSVMIAHAQYFEDNYWMMNATIAGYGGITRQEIERIDEFESFRNKYEKLLHRVLRGGIRNGEFRKVDVRAMTRSIYQLLNISRWYRPNGKKSATDFAKESFELIFNGLSADN